MNFWKNPKGKHLSSWNLWFRNPFEAMHVLVFLIWYRHLHLRSSLKLQYDFLETKRRLGILQMNQWVLMTDRRPRPSCTRSRLLKRLGSGKGKEHLHLWCWAATAPGDPPPPRQLRRRERLYPKVLTLQGRCRVPPAGLSFCSCVAVGSRGLVCRVQTCE